MSDALSQNIAAIRQKVAAGRNLTSDERAALEEIIRRQRAGTLKPRVHKKNYLKYDGDPLAYASDVLKVTLYDEQEALLWSIVNNRYTGAKASHSIGKTFTAAVAANYWYDTKEQSIVYITAPTWGQALGLTFKQIKKFRLMNRLPGEILESGIIRDLDPILAVGHYIRAINASKGEGFQGEHEAPILVLLEEAVGIPHFIWDALKGLMTHEECRAFAIANPTDEATQFGLNCKSDLWITRTISALKHPNIAAELRGEKRPFPKAVNLMWLQEMLTEECEKVEVLAGDAFEFPSREVFESDAVCEAYGHKRVIYLPNSVFQGRVLGEFPSQADEQVIPQGWLREAQEVRQPLDPELLPELGVDVARHGSDRTTIATRHEYSLLALREIRQMDNVLVTNAIREAIHAAAAPREDPDNDPWPGCDPFIIPCRIDTTGGLGTGPFDTLLSEGYNVIAMNSSSLPPEEYQDTYKNVRSWLWFGHLRQYARAKMLDLTRISREMRDKLVRELSAPKWEPDDKARKIVESKKKLKLRLGFSPDLADAVNLAFAMDDCQYGLPDTGSLDLASDVFGGNPNNDYEILSPDVAGDTLTALPWSL